MTSEYIIDIESGEDLDPLELLPKVFRWGAKTSCWADYPVVPVLEYRGFKVGDTIMYDDRDTYTIECFVDVSKTTEWAYMGGIAAGLTNTGIADLNQSKLAS